jgi:GR25 family glycosyltransferase involved in LPS biosynthesis
VKYNIISLNDERLAYKENIRANTEFEEMHHPAVDGRVVDLPTEYSKRGLFPTGWTPKLGEAGVWLSNFDRWEYAATLDEPFVVFEDDAIIGPDFDTNVSVLLEYLPDDWDFCALWVPENQRLDYFYDVEFNEIGDPVHRGPNLSNQRSVFRYGNANVVALVYQGYGMVSLMYSPVGAAKLVDLARETGVSTPVDCWIYQQAHLGRLNGYAPHPYAPKIVDYDWRAETHIQNTEKVEF